jgi:CheY-like chemotaxis protein
MEHGMKLVVTQVVGNRPTSFSPSDAPFGFRPSRAALSPLAVAAEAVSLSRGTASPDDIRAIATKSDGPVPIVSSSLDSETNRRQQALDPNKESNPNTNARIEPKTPHSILVVEDDPDITMALQDLLEFEGFHVDCAQTCRQAFSSLEQNAYNAVLLDLGLPDGDGLSILEKLQVSNPSLPVIILTASNRDLGSLRAYARLTKPWNREELCAILCQALDRDPL